MPTRVRVRHGTTTHSSRLPALSSLRNPSDEMPTAQEGIRRLQARHDRHAQAIPRQPAHHLQESRDKREVRRGVSIICWQIRLRRLCAQDRRGRAGSARLARGRE